MRVLFTSTPAWGHIHPMLPLAHAFVARGGDVLWAVATGECARLHAEGISTAACGRSRQEMAAVVAAAWAGLEHLPIAERGDVGFARIFGAGQTAPMLDDLLPLVRDWKPSLVVRDLAEFAGPIAAAVAGVPCVSHSFGEIAPAVRVARAGDDVAPLWAANGLEPRPYGGSFDDLYLDIYPPRLRCGDRSHVPQTQSLRPPSAVPAASSLPISFTDRESSPLVYLTFGTVFNDASTVAAVLEAVRTLDVRVVVTVGPDGDPAALGPQPGNVHAARYIPQDDIIPQCAAVVSHAGSGTFLATLAAGLPQLCLPQGADQFLNAAACERSASGLALNPADATPHRIREAVERLLSDTAFADRAAEVGREIAAMPSPADVADLLSDRYC